MKLKKFLKMVNKIDDIIIWFENDNDEDGPAYKGSILHVPYYLLDYKLAMHREEDEKPICIVHYENEYGNKMAAYNVVLEDD